MFRIFSVEIQKVYKHSFFQRFHRSSSLILFKFFYKILFFVLLVLAGTMKPLETNKKALIWFCAFTSDETPNKRSRLAHITFTAFTIFIFISFLLASMAYFYKFFTIDLSEAFYILIQMTNALPMMNAMIIMIFLRDKFTALYESLTGIYKTCKLVLIHTDD